MICSFKDLKALLERVDNNIEFSFGDEAGIEGFKKFWELEGSNSAKSTLWEELDTVLKLGGSFTPDGLFIAPYVASNWPEIEPYENQAVIGENVRVRAKPDVSSAILYVASYEILKTEYLNRRRLTRFCDELTLPSRQLSRGSVQRPEWPR